ncbi:glycosyltransferase family 2 protein [Mucilaginibacter arboris]|uniref:Glycosyltransferase n=1 Tax=Mucilaginibacter arboris TaxID=2682090 RepID=A0A7K1SUR9_9SPHI|nr:glycosyltransferase [Mucilaginibacter arboris]MVN21007.1 glycosyltransferase [Mucilaginibacter arboris]
MMLERLVSVIVVAYNSEEFIIETLESIWQQNYKSIELIISDDCSHDLTIKLCKEWMYLDKNKNRFTNIKILEHHENTGIASNCNRGFAKASGEWIKLIAGDDLLLPNCISSFMDYSQKNPNARVLVSKLKTFKDTPDNVLSTWPYKSVFPSKLKTQIKEQLKANFIKAPAVFLNRVMLSSLGGFNETYPFLEDDPLWTKILINNIKFHYIPKCLVAYRIHNKGVSHTPGLNLKFYDSVLRYYNDIAIPLMIEKKMYFWVYLLKLEISIWNNAISKKNKKSFLTIKQRLLLSVIGWSKRINLLFRSLG